MRKNNLKRLNNIYLCFISIVLIIMMIISFKKISERYYNDKNLNYENSKIADWNFYVQIEY